MPFTDSIKMVDVVIAEKSLLSATPSDVAAGKEFIGTTQHIETGSIPILETHISDITLGSGESYNIPYGINKVAYNVKVKKLEEETVGTANDEDVLFGKIAYVNGIKIPGTMPNNGAVTANLSAGDAYNIPDGYHKNGVITVKTLKEQTVSTSNEDDLLEGKTAWSNGNLISGAMPNIGYQGKTLYAGESITISKGYHNGKGIISTYSLASQTVGNAISSEVVQDKIVWVNGSKITGSMPLNTAETITLPMNGTYYIPNGYHTGNGSVTQNIPTKEGQTIGPTKSAQTIEVAGCFMSSDIIVTGVDALNYKKNPGIVKDSTGTNITNMNLTVEDNMSSVAIYVDDWHDGSTQNIYKIDFADLLDTSGNSITLNCQIMFDSSVNSTLILNGITITIKLDSNTNGQVITISGISSGKISMNEIISTREFGTGENE